MQIVFKVTWLQVTCDVTLPLCADFQRFTAPCQSVISSVNIALLRTLPVASGSSTLEKLIILCALWTPLMLHVPCPAPCQPACNFPRHPSYLLPHLALVPVTHRFSSSQHSRCLFFACFPILTVCFSICSHLQPSVTFLRFLVLCFTFPLTYPHNLILDLSATLPPAYCTSCDNYILYSILYVYCMYTYTILYV